MTRFLINLAAVAVFFLVSLLLSNYSWYIYFGLTFLVVMVVGNLILDYNEVKRDYKPVNRKRRN